MAHTSAEGSESAVELRLYDLQGRMVHQSHTSHAFGKIRLQIDGQKLPRGLLLYELRTAARQFKGKILHQ
ncbi:MAG: hypothetical protein AAF570_29325 [Bacteroidota bacterium]